MSKKQAGWIRRAMAESRRKANPYLADPTKLQGLSTRVLHKMDKTKVKVQASTVGDTMREAWGSVGIMGRLVRAYGKGRYRRVPWSALGAIVAALIYFVTPTDFIPDFVAGLGLMDDATIIAMVVKSVAVALEEFRAWERVQPVDAEPVQPETAATDEDGFAEIPIATEPG